MGGTLGTDRAAQPRPIPVVGIVILGELVPEVRIEVGHLRASGVVRPSEHDNP